MTNDELDALMKRADIAPGFPFGRSQIVTFSKLVEEREREACAKVCDRFHDPDVGFQPADCAEAIRARGEK